jgi:hypothetical protein
MPTDYFSKCAPLLREDFDSCAGLTLCNVAPVTDTQLDGIFQDSSGRFRGMAHLIEADMMGSACQVRENPLYKWIIANAESYQASVNTSKRRGSGITEVEPFLRVRRKGIFNNLFWTVASGTNGSVSVNGTIADAFFNLSSQTSVPNDVTWFAVGDEISIFGKSASGNATRTNWRVVYSAIVGDYVRVYVKSRNAGSALASGKLEFPTTGVAISLANNSSPYESRCNNIPRVNLKSDYLIWIQNTRWSICNDEHTQKFRKYLFDNNPLYREYYAVEEGEYNKSVLEDFQNKVAHTFLFGKGDANQTETLWNNLEQITSFSDQVFGEYIYLPGIEGRCVERRAYVKGVYEQLAECGRVIDLQGDVLNFPELQTYLYDMVRIRSDNGFESKVIEIVTDSAYKQLLLRGLYQYLRTQFGGDLRVNVDMSTFTKTGTTPLGFMFTEVDLDYPAVKLRIVSHFAFDDLVNAHARVNSNLTTAGRMIWMLAWDTVTMGVIESRFKDLSSGNVEDLAKINSDAFCRMDNPVRNIRHYLLKWTVDVKCPQASLVIENVAFQVPEVENKYGSYTDIKGNDPSND